MSQLSDPEAARRWLVEAFTEYDDARTLGGASHEQALGLTADFGYPPESWPGHQLHSRKRQAEVRQAVGRQLRGKFGGDEAALPMGNLLCCLAGLGAAGAAAAALYPEGVED